MHSVRHPYAELGVTKADIRNMAESLGLGEIASLPASPCLSSRVETGIRITPPLLRLIHAAELAVRGGLRHVRSAVACASLVS